MSVLFIYLFIPCCSGLWAAIVLTSARHASLGEGPSCHGRQQHDNKPRSSRTNKSNDSNRNSMNFP